MRASTRSNFLFASVLLAGWCACTGLIWRLVFRASVMSVADPSLRSGWGILGLIASLWLSAIPINMVHRRSGRSGNFFAWSIGVLNQLLKRRT